MKITAREVDHIKGCIKGSASEKSFEIMCSDMIELNAEIQALRTSNAEMTEAVAKSFRLIRHAQDAIRARDERLTALESENEKLRRFRKETGEMIKSAYEDVRAAYGDLEASPFLALMASDVWKETENET